MSQLTNPTDVRYFASCLYHDEKLLDELTGKKFETMEVLRPEFNPLTLYYTKEMGEGLKRKIIVFKEVGQREKLVEFKLWAGQLELETSLEGKRIINIDIGYIAKEQLLLATGKPYSHRIYLARGVFAELVYTYSEKTFKSLSWTYPDYQHEEKIAFFNRFRP